jgi:predicted acylesterase/phospholipase RssA
VSSAFGRAVLLSLAVVLCLPSAAVSKPASKPRRQAARQVAPKPKPKPKPQSAPAPQRPLRHVELKIGVVPFSDPRVVGRKTPEDEALEGYFAEVQRRYADDRIDLDVKLIRGSYYQILHWMRDGLLDGAVVSSFTAYLLDKDEHLALFPVIEFARGTSGGAKFFVRGNGQDDPWTAMKNCVQAVKDSLKEPPLQQPCEFRFVSHLSTTGFVVPLIYLEEEYVLGKGMSLPEQQAFWARLLQWSHLDLLHGAVDTKSTAPTSIVFTYMAGAQRITLPLQKDVTNLSDVLLLGCRRAQPGTSPKTNEQRLELLKGCAVGDQLTMADLAASHWQESGAVVRQNAKDPNSYVDTAMWSQNARDEFATRISSVFALNPHSNDYHDTALNALYLRWYRDGRYAFSIDEVIDVLKVDQVIRDAPRAALVLPGGGVRATYQSVILDYLYKERIVNAGTIKSPNGQCSVATKLDDPKRLVINGIAGTSGGALLGYFASRRDTSGSDALTKLWIDGQTVKTTPLDVFPTLGVLRSLSVLLLVAVFACTSAVHMKRDNARLKKEVPFWYTTFLSIIIVAAPFLIWRNARLDPTSPPSLEGGALLLIILLAHFLHSISEDGQTPKDSKPRLVRGIVTSVTGIGLAIGMCQLEGVSPAWWILGTAAALVLVVLGLHTIAGAWGLMPVGKWIRSYGEAMLLLLLMLVVAFIVFGIGWWMKRVTPLEMTVDYWVWVFVAALFSTKLILTAERVYRNVPLMNGIRFLTSPSGTAPFPYTPAVTLALWGTLAITVWLTFVAPALYSSQQGRKSFDDASATSQKAGVPLIVSMTGLGDDVKGYRSPPYRGDYYVVDRQWCFVDELQGKTSATLFRLDDEQFKNAVFASGSPFPIYPATKVQAEPGDPGLFVDGGYAHRVPIEAAGLVRAAQILVVENVARTDAPASSEGFRAGALTTNAAKALDFLFERSQTIDGQRARSAVVATIYPDWSPPDPFLMDFRESVVQRLRDEGKKDLEGHRVARVVSWGEPNEELADDGT